MDIDKELKFVRACLKIAADVDLAQQLRETPELYQAFHDVFEDFVNMDAAHLRIDRNRRQEAFLSTVNAFLVELKRIDGKRGWFTTLEAYWIDELNREGSSTPWNRMRVSLAIRVRTAAYSACMGLVR